MEKLTLRYRGRKPQLDSITVGNAGKRYVQAVAARTYAMPYVGAGKQITDQSGTHQAFRASRWDAVKYPGTAGTFTVLRNGVTPVWVDMLGTVV